VPSLSVAQLRYATVSGEGWCSLSYLSTRLRRAAELYRRHEGCGPPRPLILALLGVTLGHGNGPSGFANARPGCNCLQVDEPQHWGVSSPSTIVRPILAQSAPMGSTSDSPARRSPSSRAYPPRPLSRFCPPPFAADCLHPWQWRGADPVVVTGSLMRIRDMVQQAAAWLSQASYRVPSRTTL